MSTIHVVYGGRNEDLEFDEVFRPDRHEALGVTNPEPRNMTPEIVKRALANHYDVNQNEFEAHFVEINSNGNITVRPNARWGGH
ncbi:MAG: hypothetical protein PHF86_05355 [Candidatus Nanoarchaeia archaeon]|jgi:hypothetical protein|nr:hypothetical protein [Candidatus Nanoarchaeia archaeon]